MCQRVGENMLSRNNSMLFDLVRYADLIPVLYGGAIASYVTNTMAQPRGLRGLRPPLPKSLPTFTPKIQAFNL